MIKARPYVLRVLGEVEDGGYPNIILNQPEDISLPDLFLARKIVYGVLENYRYIDLIIKRASKVEFNKIHPDIKNIIRLSLYQLIYLDRIPERAAINEGVKLAHKIKGGAFKGFVNGILRNFLRHKEKFLSLNEFDHLTQLGFRYSIEDWLLKMWSEDYGMEETKNVLENIRMEHAPFIRLNLQKTNREELIERLRLKNIETTTHRPKTSLSLKGDMLFTNLPEYNEGLFSFQNLSSQEYIERLPMREKVLDIASAPGGKTFAYLERYPNSKVVACDIYSEKLKEMKKNIKRLGLNNIELIENDATILREEWKGKFDLIICDLPCSDLGVITNKPDVAIRRKSEDINALSKLQSSILSIAKEYLVGGGMLCYSTCTLSKRENKEQVRKFLEKNNFKLIEERETLPNSEGYHGFYYAIMEKCDE